MTNPHESQLQYPLGDTLPAPGEAIEIAQHEARCRSLIGAKSAKAAKARASAKAA